MGVCSTPISQIVSSTTESVELNRVQETPISTRYENKTDETNAMIQLMLNKFDEKFNKFDVLFNKFDAKLDEQKSDSIVKYDKINARFDISDTKINDKFEMQNNELKLMRGVV